jgi:hypothetical protein
MKLTAIVLLCGAAVSAQPAPDSIKLDNEFVRVLFLTDQRRTKTPLHRHELNRVMIYLDPIKLVLRYQDGEPFIASEVYRGSMSMEARANR